ncbi:OCA2 melanosomal transmembrane protein hoepel1 isoform X1 [Haematobia irritans]|uniref:OCA2 melanosomal transmembrane protein hoepel1 isoform X1 n=1 Tax=Haematobia irritans TaxID=7368 RepID=UPI003F5056F1
MSQSNRRPRFVITDEEELEDYNPSLDLRYQQHQYVQLQAQQPPSYYSQGNNNRTGGYYQPSINNEDADNDDDEEEKDRHSKLQDIVHWLHQRHHSDNREVTEGALQVWRALPERIRQDPSLASFRQEHERLHGYEPPDVDPLPNDDVDEHDHNNGKIVDGGGGVIICGSGHDKNSSVFSPIGINVTNEMGQVRILDGRDVENNNEDQQDETEHHGHSTVKKYLIWFKIAILLVVWGVFTAFLMSTNEHVDELKLISIPKNGTERVFPITTAELSRIGVSLTGAFRLQEAEAVKDTLQRPPPRLEIFVERTYYNESGEKAFDELVSRIWLLELVYPEFMDTTRETHKTHQFQIEPLEGDYANNTNLTELTLHFVSNIEAELPLQLSIDESPIYKKEGVIYAAVVLCGLYVMIIWEIVNRTFAAIIASTLSVGILAALNSRPSMVTIMGWIDVETLLLLFGMMILVAILSETGVFDYLAVYAYKITNGHVWPLINCLCLFTAILSSFLDNVTTVLLMTPVTIRLCEVMSLNPVPILMCMVIYSNIGGALTPVGDPPNVIIASNSFISKNGVNFAIFTLHMLPGVVLVMFQTYLQLRYKFRNISDLQFKESPEVEELRHEIHVWKRAAASLSSYSKDEELVRQTLMKKVNRLKRSLKKKMSTAVEPAINYQQTLENLQAKYPIRNKPLLIKCSCALVFVISLFFLHSVPELQRLSLGWTALLGAIFLIILADIEDMEAILARVEWSTLLFFAALFILMEALSELGLIEWIGNMTENIILGVGEESRLMVAVLIILWVSAIASAFVDNIPLTTMMVKITISLAQNTALNLPLQPLVWALAFGACLGGNGTLIGASANVVCAGVAEQHGYKFTFLQFFKVGFPVMIGSIIISTGYLLVSHVLFAWH